MVAHAIARANRKAIVYTVFFIDNCVSGVEVEHKFAVVVGRIVQTQFGEFW
jgi:hypothetical protein